MSIYGGKGYKQEHSMWVPMLGYSRDITKISKSSHNNNEEIDYTDDAMAIAIPPVFSGTKARHFRGQPSTGETQERHG